VFISKIPVLSKVEGSVCLYFSNSNPVTMG
jgi:hypothetical protein